MRLLKNSGPKWDIQTMVALGYYQEAEIKARDGEKEVRQRHKAWVGPHKTDTIQC